MRIVTITLAVIACACLATGCGFKKYKCKSMQSEVQAELRIAVEMMEGGRAETGKYPATMEELEAAGFEPAGQYYDYEIVSVSEEKFVLQGTGKGDMAGDVWQIDQDLATKAVSDRCK